MLDATRRSRPILCLAAAALAISGLGAQAPTAPAAPAADSTPIIRAVDIYPGRIFDSAEATSTLYRVMNKLHITTKPYVIRQQLLFTAGHPWDTAEVSETVRNLRTLGLFRAVIIDSVPTDSGVIANVRTQDAWTTGIVFSFKSTGSQIGYAVGVNEKNLLGSGTQVQLQYGKNPNRDSILFGLTRNFALGTPLTVGLQLNKLSDGTNDSIAISLPFRTLETEKGGALGAKVYNGRILQYVNGDSVPQDTLRRSFQLIYVDPAKALHASSRGYVRLGLYAQVERNDFEAYSTDTLARNYTAALGPYLAVSYPKYETVQYYEAGGREETLQLGYSATLSLLLAPQIWGYTTNAIAPGLTMSAGQATGHAWLLESLAVTSLFGTSGLDSGTVNANVTAAWQPTPHTLLIGYAGAGAQKNGYQGEEYDLGFGYAVRSYPQHAFTGDRMFITAAEYRWIFIPNFYHLVAVGVSAFVDHSGAWYYGSPVRTGTDFGVGLRFGSRTGSPGYMMRADIGYRLANNATPAGWVFSFGKGFVWQNF
jgi:hypothetical protein